MEILDIALDLDTFGPILNSTQSNNPNWLFVLHAIAAELHLIWRPD